MKIKCLEIRDRATMIAVMCFKPIPDNEAQRFLLRHDGWSCEANEHCVMLIDTHRQTARHDPYDYPKGSRTMPLAHQHIEQNWDLLNDGDVVDVEYILGETSEPKRSERCDRA
jgi:hypothetical protein